MKKDVLQNSFCSWNSISLLHSPPFLRRWFCERCVGLVQQAKVSQGWMCHNMAVVQRSLVTLESNLGRTDSAEDEPYPEVLKVPWRLRLYWSPFIVILLVLPLWAKWKLMWAVLWGGASGYISKIHVCEKFAYIQDKDRRNSCPSFP